MTWSPWEEWPSWETKPGAIWQHHSACSVLLPLGAYGVGKTLRHCGQAMSCPEELAMQSVRDVSLQLVPPWCSRCSF